MASSSSSSSSASPSPPISPGIDRRRCPKLGPDPTLLCRKEVDVLYEILDAVVSALNLLKVEYIITGGSLLGAVRQHSMLFCDDDIDLAVIDTGRGEYDRVRDKLANCLGSDFKYSIRPWEGGDQVRHTRMPGVFLDVFVLRRYRAREDLVDLLGATKKNGRPQSEDYVRGILDVIEASAFSQGERRPLYPLWHFSTRKAVEMWPKEVYRESELLPLSSDLKFGPLMGVTGPRMPVLLLKRAFGHDCFEVYYQSLSHKQKNGVSKEHQQRPPESEGGNARDSNDLPPLVLGGGTWENSKKVPLNEEHYLPMQPVARAKRRPTLHCKELLFRYLHQQEERESLWVCKDSKRPECTVYMDGVFDLFHVGHLEAIRQCAALGNRVIIGVTGDKDAAGYKRPPIISEADRVAVIEALQDVDLVICPCPLVVTQEFMEEHGIDLVVHGFSSDDDAKRQEVFFKHAMKLGKFQRISYYHGLSTTDIINKIRALPN